MKTVFDTNVLLADFISRQGLCATILQVTLIRHSVFISEYILDEFRKHLSAQANLRPDQVEAAIQLLRELATFVNPISVAEGQCRDPKDLPILGTASAASADVLITGDEDLLVLEKFGSREILSPRQFHDRYIAVSAA